MKNSILAISFVVLAGFLVWFFWDNLVPSQQAVNQNINQSADDSQNRQQNQAEELTIQAKYETKIVYTTNTSQDSDVYQEDCNQRGGEFKECGDPCPPSADICAAVCAYTCDLEDKDAAQFDDWLFYENEAGYGIAYPQKMELNENEQNITLIFVGDSQKTGTELYDGIKLDIRVEENQDQRSLKDYVQQKINNLPEISELTIGSEETDLAGQTAYQYSVQSLGTTKHILTGMSENQVLHIYYSNPDPNNQGYATTTEKIISTIEIK